MEVTSNPEYVSIIRLTVSGIANKIGFSLDDIEDIKVAVSEACTNAIKHSLDDKFLVQFSVLENGLTIEVEDKGTGYDVESLQEPDLTNPKESGLGLFIIKTLMDEVSTISNSDVGTRVKMTKYLGVGI
ncbi:MAG: ATP-binding protein [Paraclostridium bifermentans]|uniref:Histidine kinase n=3 Tax=Peptostreptococcaceae TaxID=186804 RepID=A0A1X2JDK0_PARBF|nr:MULTISPECIES: ATP-binding protein [Paraclostridium]MCU9807565.1 ATP-binding protein [Paraclostridium sp. AKS46]MDM8127464.1 ATP-binding protein [Paraclostridium benzoelyticum]MDU7904108.1 ATP-binding protein [Peptostreptococcaceae bacterium]EQK40597.1 serine-protein kinase rsbW [[Clostridium] bifermentans ATCC 638] [Paraclostridium bifermentans ATCC 638 = DSM 14991]EQK49612.1 serine-protein kinase rsbW [[Clostridium] bifermentans ATCC 19299] [Paraclostridium bifermentans ATCC 19299]